MWRCQQQPDNSSPSCAARCSGAYTPAAVAPTRHQHSYGQRLQSKRSQRSTIIEHPLTDAKTACSRCRCAWAVWASTDQRRRSPSSLPSAAAVAGRCARGSSAPAVCWNAHDLSKTGLTCAPTRARLVVDAPAQMGRTVSGKRRRGPREFSRVATAQAPRLCDPATTTGQHDLRACAAVLAAPLQSTHCLWPLRCS
jgi:hypothetical protein